jgi:CHASE3 domain sensor protein
MTRADAVKALMNWLPGDRAGWVSAIPLSLVVVVGALLSIRSHYLPRHDRALVIHSFEVLRAADDVLAETGQRGFVITGNPEFLGPYAQATAAIPAALQRLMSLVGDNVQQFALINAQKEVADRKLEELGLTVATRQSQGFSAAQSLVARRTGKDAMDRIRALTRQIKQSEEQLLAARSTEVHHDEQRIIVIIIVTTLLSTLLRFALAAWRQRAAEDRVRPLNRGVLKKAAAGTVPASKPGKAWVFELDELKTFVQAHRKCPSIATPTLRTIGSVSRLMVAKSGSALAPKIAAQRKSLRLTREAMHGAK